MGIGGLRMQDRFKFRVWKVNEKRMVEGVTYLNPLILDEEINLDEAKNNILMQCTGLKDKNGKLIFEGDIIDIWCKNLTKNQISEVKFNEERAAFTFDYFTDYGNIVPCTMEKTEIKVIGNIYENPELLEY